MATRKAYKPGKAFRENVPDGQEYLSPQDISEVTPEHVAKVYKNLSPFQQRIVYTKRKYPRMDMAEIGRVLGVTKAAISKQFRVPELEKIYEWLNRDVYSKLEHLQIKALDVLNDLLDNPDPWLRLSASQTVTKGLVDSKFHIQPPDEKMKMLITDSSKEGEKPEEVG